MPSGSATWPATAANHLGVAGSGSSGQSGPFINLLDAKLIIYDNKITSQFFSQAVVSNYLKKWPKFHVIGLYKARTRGDRHIILYIYTFVYLIFSLKIWSQMDENRGLQERMVKGTIGGQRTTHTL